MNVYRVSLRGSLKTEEFCEHGAIIYRDYPDAQVGRLFISAKSIEDISDDMIEKAVFEKFKLLLGFMGEGENETLISYVEIYRKITLFSLSIL